MTRELCAYALLAAILIGSLLNISFMEGTVGELREEAYRAYLAAEAGDTDTARDILTAASDRWASLDSYTHVFIKHGDINSATDAFFDMLTCIENGDPALGSYRRLDAQLYSIVSAEGLSFGSIF